VVALDAGTPTPLAYADAASRPPLPAFHRSALFRIAAACWLVPLAVGLAILAASEIVRAAHHGQGPFFPVHGGPPAVSPAFTLLATLGVLDLAGGTLLAGCGATAVLVFVVTRWAAAVDRWRQVLGPAGVLMALLAFNFVVAWFSAQLAIR
jgi:hypothetical protein